MAATFDVIAAVVMAFPLRVGATLLTLGALRACLFLVAITPAAAQEVKPSFDCAKARSPAEMLICSDPDLAQLDRALSIVYQVALHAGIVDELSQRAWIRRRDAECVARDAKQCLRARMQTRIAELSGRNPSLAEHLSRIPLSSRPSADEARETCNYVASRGPPIALELIGSGILDANNDGRPDEVSVGVAIGTMRGDTLEFRPSGAAKDSQPTAITREDSGGENDWGFGARWLRYRGRAYTLHFESETLRRAIYLGYIDAQNVEHVVCRFANVEREELKPVTKSVVELCRRVASGQANYIPVNEEPEQQATERRETSLKGRVGVDFRNIRRRESLVLLSYVSGAGRGCNFDYFDVISDNRLVSGGESHDILMRLQAIESSGPGSSGPCGDAAPRWFEYRGRTYLDYASDGDHGLIGHFHNVKSVADNRIERECKGDFKVKWEIRTIGPAFQKRGVHVADEVRVGDGGIQQGRPCQR